MSFKKMAIAFFLLFTFAVTAHAQVEPAESWEQWWVNRYPLPTSFPEDISSYGLRFKWLRWFRNSVVHSTTIPTPTVATATATALTTTSTTVSSVSVNDSVTGTGLNQFEYVGSWQTFKFDGLFQGDEHVTYTADDYYQFRFTGTQVQVYTYYGLNTGIAAFSVDGGAETTVDTYSASDNFQTLAYQSPVLPQGNHILKVRATGQSNPSAVNVTLVADRVDVISQSASPTDVPTTIPTAVPTAVSPTATTVPDGPSPTPDPCTTAIPGDADCNGVVNLTDFEIIRRSTSIVVQRQNLFDAWISSFLKNP